MLKQTIVVCPDAEWFNPDDVNKFSQIAYHALFYTHLYLQDSMQTFQGWTGHREEYRLQGDKTVPNSTPATKALVLDYLAFCQNEVVERVSNVAFDAASGFDWLPFNKFELQLYTIRHIQHHVGELMERLNARAGIELDWVATGAKIENKAE